MGVSKHTIYAWKAKYGGMDVSQAQEAKQLRDENTRLRKLVADPSRALPGPDRLLPFGLVVAIVILGQAAFAVKCVRERVVLGAIMASLVSALVAAVAPGVVSPVAGGLRIADYMLWGLAIVISVTMFVSSIRSHAPQSE